jgi:hypothetical protein
MIKFWAFVYRRTGWYSPFARMAEHEYIKRNMRNIEAMYLKKGNDMSLHDLIGLHIGLWQADHGFTRPFTGISRKFKKKLKVLKENQ